MEGTDMKWNVTKTAAVMAAAAAVIAMTACGSLYRRYENGKLQRASGQSAAQGS